MTNTYRRLVLWLVICLLVIPTGAVAITRGSPEFQVSLDDRTVSPGENATVTLTIGNGGHVDLVSNTNPSLADRVTAARGVEVSLTPGDAPVTVTSGPVVIGSVPGGATATAPFTVQVAENAEPGTYEMDVEVSYDYTKLISDRTSAVQTEHDSETFEVTLVVRERARFVVEDVSTDVATNDDGTLSVTLRNVGRSAARDSVVTVAAPGGGLTFDGSTTASRYVGSWPANASRTVEFTASPTARTAVQTYALEARVAFDDGNGDPTRSDPLSIGITPNPPVDVTIRELTSSLAVGSPGQISATVVNTGNRTAANGIVVLGTNSTTTSFEEIRIPIGTLRPGERTRFTVDARTAASASPDPLPLSIRLEYRGSGGDRVTTKSEVAVADVAASTHLLSVSSVNATFAPDSEDRLVVSVTNTGEEPLREVRAEVGTSSPFQSVSSEAFVESLAAGETVRMSFQLSVSEDAVESTHALPVNVTARTQSGREVGSGPHLVAVTVAQPPGQQSSVAVLLAGAVLVLVVLAAGYWWLRP